jgi:hypothetical protein
VLIGRPGFQTSSTVSNHSTAPLDAVQAAQEIGFPVAVKILSPDIINKSDVGVVVLDLETPTMRSACLRLTWCWRLISRTRVCKLLSGYRNRPPADIDAICSTLIQVSALAADLAELDINPLLADNWGVMALNARVRVLEAGYIGQYLRLCRDVPHRV